MIKTASDLSVKQRRKSVFISLMVVFCICILVSLYPAVKKSAYKDLSPFVSTTVEYADGERTTFPGIKFGSVNKGDRITMQVSLPLAEAIDPAIMVFGANHAVTQVLYRDTLLTSYGEDIDSRGDLVCHHNFFVKIPEKAWGDVITVSMRATEDRAFTQLAELWLYPAEEAYHFYFDLEPGRMAVAFSVLIISFSTLLTVPLLMRQDIIRYKQLFFLALFGLVSAAWMVLAEGLQQFFAIDSYLLTTFEFVALVAQLIPLGGYVLIEETFERQRKRLEWLLAADTVYLVLVCALNYSGIAHFPATLSASVVVIIVNAAVFIGSSLRNMDFSVTSKRFSLFGISALSFTGIFDVVRFCFSRMLGTAAFPQTQKVFPLGVLFFFVLLMISSIVGSREREEKERHNRAKLLTGQIQPHFLYNTLASIREIIFEDPQYAADTLKNFTTYLRGTVHALSEVQVVPFEEELKNIRAYAEIEKMRMPDRLHIEYRIEEKDFVLPPFSIQPLVENAIRHGIFKRGDAGGCVTVSSYAKRDKWIVEVRDNGVGFDTASVMKEIGSADSPSAGLHNALSRLREITGAAVSVQSVPSIGTTVTVVIPQLENLALRMREQHREQTKK